MYSLLRTFIHFFKGLAELDQRWSWAETCTKLTKDKFLG